MKENISTVIPQQVISYPNTTDVILSLSVDVYRKYFSISEKKICFYEEKYHCSWKVLRQEIGFRSTCFLLFKKSNVHCHS